MINLNLEKESLFFGEQEISLDDFLHLIAIICDEFSVYRRAKRDLNKYLWYCSAYYESQIKEIA